MQTNNRPVVCAGVGFEDAARQLAGSLGLEFSESPQTGELRLTLDADGLSLGDGAVGLRGDLSALAGRIQPRRLRGSAARSRGAGGGGNRLLRGTAIGRSGLSAACEGHLPRVLFVDGCAHLHRRVRYRRA